MSSMLPKKTKKNNRRERERERMKKFLLTPPQLSVLAKSLPVPNGRMATGGEGLIPKMSKMDKIQPTVPSPPHASTRKLGTFLYNSSLQINKKRKFIRSIHAKYTVFI